MDNLNDYLNKTVNMDYDELVLYTKKAIIDLMGRLKSFLTEDQAGSTILYIVCCSVSADRQFTEKEQQFFKDVFGADKAQALAAIKDGGGDKAKEVVIALSGMNDETKALVFILVSAIAAIDGEINVDETSFLREILDS